MDVSDAGAIVTTSITELAGVSALVVAAGLGLSWAIFAALRASSIGKQATKK